MKKIYEFIDYKKYLLAVEEERLPYQNGFRSRIAENLNCQNAYVSQVLNTHSDFSAEQALKIGEFLSLSDNESRYFLYLVEFARAGTKPLQAIYKKDIDQMRENFFNIRERVPETRVLDVREQTVYYSSWLYPTIQMLTTIPEYRTPHKIAQVMRVSESSVREALLFLTAQGLVVEHRGELRPGNTQIHLSKDSTLIKQHHSLWRLAAIQSLGEMGSKDLHYSTVSSLSKEDAEKLLTKLLAVIEDYVKTILPSKEETLYNFNLDFYSLIR